MSCSRLCLLYILPSHSRNSHSVWQKVMEKAPLHNHQDLACAIWSAYVFMNAHCCHTQCELLQWCHNLQQVLWCTEVWQFCRMFVCICRFNLHLHTHTSHRYSVTQSHLYLYLCYTLIMVWKVAGEFVSPMNMTIGSNNPLLVLNAAFHLSSSLMWTLL